jgi:hypothetical protein
VQTGTHTLLDTLLVEAPALLETKGRGENQGTFMRSLFYKVLHLRFFSLACLCLAAAIPAAAENEIRIDPAHGRLGWITNPYRQRTVPPRGQPVPDRTGRGGAGD